MHPIFLSLLLSLVAFGAGSDRSFPGKGSFDLRDEDYDRGYGVRGKEKVVRWRYPNGNWMELRLGSGRDTAQVHAYKAGSNEGWGFGSGFKHLISVPVPESFSEKEIKALKLPDWVRPIRTPEKSESIALYLNDPQNGLDGANVHQTMKFSEAPASHYESGSFGAKPLPAARAPAPKEKAKASTKAAPFSISQEPMGRGANPQQSEKVVRWEFANGNQVEMRLGASDEDSLLKYLQNGKVTKVQEDAINGVPVPAHLSAAEIKALGLPARVKPIRTDLNAPSIPMLWEHTEEIRGLAINPDFVSIVFEDESLDGDRWLNRRFEAGKDGWAKILDRPGPEDFFTKGSFDNRQEAYRPRYKGDPTPKGTKEQVLRWRFPNGNFVEFRIGKEPGNGLISSFKADGRSDSSFGSNRRNLVAVPVPDTLSKEEIKALNLPEWITPIRTNPQAKAVPTYDESAKWGLTGIAMDDSLNHSSIGHKYYVEKRWSDAAEAIPVKAAATDSVAAKAPAAEKPSAPEAKKASPPPGTGLRQEGRKLSYQAGDGSLIELGNQASYLEGDAAVDSKFYEHKGERYALVSVNRGDDKAGESFLVRHRDGRAVRFANSFVDPAGVKIEDGIFAGGAPRDLDLDRFDAEAKAQTPLHKSLRDKTFDYKKKHPGAMMQGFGGGASELGEADIAKNETFNNLTETLRGDSRISGKVDPALEKDLLSGLLQDEMGSSVLLGEAGTGKTTDVKGVVKRVANGETPIPRTWRFVEMDAASLGAGSGKQGEFEKKVQNIVDMAKDRPTVFVVDEIHSLKGQGTHSESSVDIFQMLKPHLSSGDVKIIGMSTADEFYETFGGDPALLRRFSVANKKAPATADEVRPILRSWLQRFKKPAMDDAVLNRIFELSEKFNAVGAQPSKSTALLQRIFSGLEYKGVYNQAPTVAMVEEAAQSLYNLPAETFDPKAAKHRVRELPGKLDEKIQGQDKIKQTMADVTSQAYSGLAKEDAPKISMLIAGPRGTGKTTILKTYADAMGLPLAKIEMSRYASGKTPDDLMREVTEAVRKNPAAVVLFDEIEKAPLSIQNALLTAMDSGRFSVNEASTPGAPKRKVPVNVRNATFVFTTNSEDLKAISEPLLDRVQSTMFQGTPDSSAFRSALRQHFDSVYPKIEARAGGNLHLSAADKEALLDRMAAKFYREGISNRDIQKILEESVIHPFSRAFISLDIDEDAKLRARLPEGNNCQLLFEKVR